jgi:hypothetical protein
MAFEVKLGPQDGSRLRAEIRLDDLFDSRVVDNPAAREALAGEVIEAIRARAEDFGGTYSESYADSLAFKAFGKSKSDVNLTQTGAMLSSIDVIESDRDRIVIGFNEELQSKKAHGHVTGAVGKKRDFFRVTKAELNAIASRYEDDLTQPELAEDAATDLDTLAVLQGLAESGLTGVLQRIVR